MYVRDVCIGVHSKNLWSIGQWQPLDVVDVFLDNLEDWYVVSFVEVEGWFEYPLIEPQLDCIGTLI